MALRRRIAVLTRNIALSGSRWSSTATDVAPGSLHNLSLTSLAPHPPPSEAYQDDIKRLAEVISRHDRPLIITGAGMSTASGIPDYRGPFGSYSRGHKPMSHQEFMKNVASRQRYWARNYVGFAFFSLARPNYGHIALASLEKIGLVDGIITQNVDRLHQKAGSQNVVDLHGNNDQVICMSCHQIEERSSYQERLRQMNEEWLRGNLRDYKNVEEIRADGDADFGKADYSTFTVPACKHCEGIMKPNVVYFGASVPTAVVEHCYQQVAESDLIVVAGTSLAVWSAFRFVKAGNDKRKPIVIVNMGETRADPLASMKIQAPCCEVLAGVEGELNPLGAEQVILR